jgi:alpha/beta superfamily hydrolase
MHLCISMSLPCDIALSLPVTSEDRHLLRAVKTERGLNQQMSFLQILDRPSANNERQVTEISAVPGVRLREQPGYFEIAGEHVYTVVHQVEAPIARVLLIGPFASSRYHSYIPWVRWARYLAAKGIEVLRFDYRGVGESTGTFEQMGFSDWMEDVAKLSAWLKAQSPDAPVILHGLGLGALFAGRTFHGGAGDGLILWSPPANANAALRPILANWAMLQKLGKRAEEHKPLSHYIEQFETAGCLEVNGYVWSQQLWRDSFDFDLPGGMGDPGSVASAYDRPVNIVTLGKETTPLLKEGLTGYDESKDFDWLFLANFNWITSILAVCHQ